MVEHFANPTSHTRTYFEGRWRDGNQPIMGPRTHGMWLGSTVFDGARRFEGVAPDLELHFCRVNESAKHMGLQPTVSVAEWLDRAEQGFCFFSPNASLYIRPMYWAVEGYGGGVRFDPSSTSFCLSIYEAPMPSARNLALTLSPFRRPTNEFAPVQAKASCHYANSARALMEASSRGFDNCVMLDKNDDVCELANANIFIAKHGAVMTPKPNGAFLAGITRARVISLMKEAGIDICETQLSYEDVLEADEIFSTGNFQKLAAFTRIEGRELSIGPIYREARKLYWDFALEGSSLRNAS